MTDTQRITGKIAAILNKYSVVINRGYNDGVDKGDTFYIYTELGPFFDPDTNDNLGTTKKIWGKVRVSTLEKRFCIAETDYTPDIASLTAVFAGSRVQLPVDEREFIKDATKITIGTPVISSGFPRQIATQTKEALPEPASEGDDETEQDETETP